MYFRERITTALALEKSVIWALQKLLALFFCRHPATHPPTHPGCPCIVFYKLEFFMEHTQEAEE
jgi:hypothetical protein